MSERDYYPPGAYDDPNAPYNEIEVPERDFDVLISQTLSKNTEVLTNDYLYHEWVEEDEMGKRLEKEWDTSDTNWEEAYINNHYTPLQLIELFKEHLEKALESTEDKSTKKRYQELIKECSDWVEDDIEVFEDK